jgi:hypothetical protein
VQRYREGAASGGNNPEKLCFENMQQIKRANVVYWIYQLKVCV